MRRAYLYIAGAALLLPLIPLLPSTVSAEGQNCSENGYTVVYVNGVFDTYPQALNDSDTLRKKLGIAFNSEPITVQLGYNPTHLAGAGDLAQSGAQISGWFGGSLSDYDLDTILMQIYPEVTTRKLLIVGHSQGALYANEMYWYLTTHGEPREALGVYGVATPASMVAGDGGYLNSDNDTLINLLRTFNSHVLPSNYFIPISAADSSSTWPGHSFVGAYLAGAPDKIVSDLQGELSSLQPADAGAGDCFTPPQASLGYSAQTMLFAVADPTVSGTIAGVEITGKAAAAVAASALRAVASAQNAFTNVVTSTQTAVTSPSNTEKNFKIVKQLYGSSLDEQDVKDLLAGLPDGKAGSQASAVALAAQSEDAPVEIDGGFVEGTSTSLSASTEATSSPLELTTATTTTAPATSSAPVIDPNFFNWIPGGGGTFAPALSDDADISSPVPGDSATTSASSAISPAPFNDTFDSYTGAGWTPLVNDEHYILFTHDDGSDGSCHSGGCLRADGGAGGLGGGAQVAAMYTTAAGQDSGALTIWAQAHKGAFEAEGLMGFCAATDCSSKYVFNDLLHGSASYEWHNYYLAWRQGSTSVQFCGMQDDTSSSDCAWSDSSFSSGTQIQGLILWALVGRPDLGDNVWFDDLAPAQ